MRVTDRFADYGVTGGLFWFLQIILMLILGLPAWLSNPVHHLFRTYESFPSALQSSLGALLGALGIVAIFFTGLAFDLPAGWRPGEIFVDYIRRHRDVMERVSESYGSNCFGEDYRSVLEASPVPPILGAKAERFRWRKPPSCTWSELLTHHERLETFLTCLVGTTSGSGGSDLLANAAWQWRVTRASSAVFVILACEASFETAFLCISWALHARSAPARTVPFRYALIWLALFGIMLLFSLLGQWVGKRGYARFCETLFALASLTKKENQHSVESLGTGNATQDLELRLGARVKDVRFTKETMAVDLIDGRTITVPLVWYPRLLEATPPQRRNWQIAGAGYGIHWPDIDEDLSTEGLLRGIPASHEPARTGAV